MATQIEVTDRDSKNLGSSNIMKNKVHKIATYVALILISALPLSVDVYADSDNKSNPIILSGDDEDALIAKRKRQKENDQ
jgi:hypothetical protein